MSRTSRPDACMNCGSTRVAEYCADCGQRNLDVRVPARELVRDAVEDGLSLDSRMGRTVLPFLFRPGSLVVEWSQGRRARYSSPLRLFLLTSFVFFLATGFGLDVGSSLRAAEPGGAPGAPVVEGLDAGLAGAREGFEAGFRAAGAGAKGEPDAKDDASPSITFRPGEPVPHGTTEQHADLRSKGWLGRIVDDRWKAFEGMSQKEAIGRVQAAFREWVPRVTFFLVPAAVLILLLLWPRRWLAEHVVLAFHLHAFAFTVFTALLLVHLLPEGLVRTVLTGLLWLSIPAWFLLALRRVFGQRWRWTVLKAFVASFLYLLALGLGMAGVGLLAVYFA